LIRAGVASEEVGAAGVREHIGVCDCSKTSANSKLAMHNPLAVIHYEQLMLRNLDLTGILLDDGVALGLAIEQAGAFTERQKQWIVEPNLSFR
jgi:hypothetical protein